jgi:signal transduction histidine kinase
MRFARPSRAGSAGTPSELLRIIAHDVRSPLNIISMASDLLESRIEQTADLQRPLRIIRAAIRQIDRIVEDVLVAGAAEVSATSSSPVTEAGALISEVVDQYRDMAELHGVLLQGEPPPVPVFVAIAREPMLRALANLVGNAIRHTLPGGLVRLAAHQLRAAVAFLVSDTGVGMAQAEVERLLLSVPHERSSAASGHGLSIVYGIARRAGGHLSAVSHPGVGSTFTICIPAANPADAGSPRRRRHPNPELS